MSSKPKEPFQKVGAVSNASNNASKIKIERLGLSAEAPMSTAYSWHHLGTVLRGLKVYIHIFSWNDLEQQTSAQGRPEETQCVSREHQSQGETLGQMNKAHSKLSLQMGNCCLFPKPLHSLWDSFLDLEPETIPWGSEEMKSCHSEMSQQRLLSDPKLRKAWGAQLKKNKWPERSSLLSKH